MNYGLILAGGIGQRLRNVGIPKQFLEVNGKPIIIYTLEKFECCSDIDKIVVVCKSEWIDFLKGVIQKYGLKKVIDIVPGGSTRIESTEHGLNAIKSIGADKNDIIVVHDGVRPLISVGVISENIQMAKQNECAMTVTPARETVVVTENNHALYEEFMARENTYTLTSPQTFTAELLDLAMNSDVYISSKPLLDAAMVCASLNKKVALVKENDRNIKITTPEDYYIFKALIELEENRSAFGL